MNRKLRMVVAPVVVLLAVTACKPAEPDDVSGRVINKETRFVGKVRHNWLIVQKASGSQTRFEVRWSTYTGCVRGSAYPACRE